MKFKFLSVWLLLFMLFSPAQSITASDQELAARQGVPESRDIIILHKKIDALATAIIAGLKGIQDRLDTTTGRVSRIEEALAQVHKLAQAAETLRKLQERDSSD
jgi:hypothetical protein